MNSKPIERDLSVAISDGNLIDSLSPLLYSTAVVADDETIKEIVEISKSENGMRRVRMKVLTPPRRKSVAAIVAKHTRSNAHGRQGNTANPS